MRNQISIFRASFLVALLLFCEVAVSESQFSAYFIDKELIESSFSSEDHALLARVTADPNGLISDFSGRFSGKTLQQAIRDLIFGQEQPGHPFHNSFALWIIVDALVSDRPPKPDITDSFVDLYDFNEALAENGNYPNVLNIFQALNAEIENAFPFQLFEWADVPGFAYIGQSDLKVVANESKKLIAEIKSQSGWVEEIEEPNDLLKVLRWLEDAKTENKNLLIVMEGPL